MPLAVPFALLRRLPHLGGFFPGTALLPAEAAPEGCRALVLDGVGPAWCPGPRGALVATEALFQAPRFGRRQAPVALVVAADATGRGDALGLTLGASAEDSAGLDLMARLREARIGGAAGLPDPGPAGLGLPTGEAVVVLDPGRKALAQAANALLQAALAEAAGRPVLVALGPGAPAGARPVLRPMPGARWLARRLAPWTLVDLAAELHGLGQDATELLALVAGVPLRSPAPWARRPAPGVFAALAAATRCADPFHGRPWRLDQALDQLATWRLAEAEHRRVVACTGIEWFKQARLRDALAHQGGAPRVTMRGSAAIRLARQGRGAVGVWSATMPPGLPARCAAAGVELVQMEDGFIRSAGLGVLLAPAASMVLDRTGMHFDAAAPGDLERILATAEFDPVLLARAAALRAALIETG